MKTKTKLLRLGALLMAVLLSMASPVSVYATNNTGIVPGGDTAGAGGPVIDRETGSLTIYKYDKQIRETMNAEEIKKAAGTETVGEYGVAGVKFTYVKIADLTEQQTRTVKTVSGNEISTSVTTVFELNDALKGILWPAGTEQPTGISLGGGKTGYTTTQLNAALETLYGEAGDGMTGAPTAVKNALESYIKTQGEQAASVVTDANGMAAVENLPLGLYLVVETEVPRNVTSTVNPFFVSIPMTNAAGNGWEYDVTVYPKNQLESDEDKPTLKKTVKKTAVDSTVTDGNAPEGYREAIDASFGDELEYRIVCRLPVITSEATYLTEFTIKDEASGGLRYKKGSFQIDFYGTEADANAGTAEKSLKTWKETTDTAYFTVADIAEADLTEGYSAGKSIQITPGTPGTTGGLDVINKGENSGANYSGKYLVVTYRAEFSPEGAILGEAEDLEGAGNRNHAILYWKRTGGGEDPSDPTPPGPEDESIVFTYGLQLDKLFYRGDNQVSGNDASTVKFRLKKEGTGYIQAAKDKATAGNYDVTGFAADEADADQLSPGSDGKLLLRGLSAGTYTLKETETLSDYALLVNDVTIKITATEAELVDTPAAGAGAGGKAWDITEKATASVTGLGSTEAKVTMESYVVNGLTSMNALVKLEIVNKALPFLANTGGIGILPFLLGGGALILISVLLLWRRKKKSAAAGMMAVVVLAGVLSTAASFDAEAVNLREKCSLKVETRTNTETNHTSNSNIADDERPNLTVDLYKIADAVAVPEESSAAGNTGPQYDMYTLKLTKEFAALQELQDAADKVTQADLDAILYADLGAEVRQNYLKLANKATKSVLGIKAEDEKVVDSGKDGMNPLATETVNGANGAGVFANLDPGLYLAIPHGTALTDPVDYTVALTGSEDPELELTDGNLATVAYGRKYIYRYMPELIALPQRDPTKAGGAEGSNAGSSDAWQYAVTATLKAEAASRYASLKIVKDRAFGAEEGDPKNPGLTGEDNFVYQVEATLGGKSVYSNVVMLTMPANENKVERTLELIVPVGAKITVTEVYTGASHELPENAEAVKEIPSAAADKTGAGDSIVPGNILTFTNKYNGTGTGGGVVENRFTYGDKEDGGKGWNWEAEPAGAKKPGGGGQGGGTAASGGQETGNAQGGDQTASGDAQDSVTQAQ